mmetsp:Transcript_36381/g.107402  ORF Transcript_36381/g.107402 Transcript_36381/m.107402 type:complete len:117 (+) Transcript_36381:1572-1922(+)|eukprot:363145-Chlamydomonas_euryale.AAC.5
MSVPDEGSGMRKAHLMRATAGLDELWHACEPRMRERAAHANLHGQATLRHVRMCGAVLSSARDCDARETAVCSRGSRVRPAAQLDIGRSAARPGYPSDIQQRLTRRRHAARRPAPP